MRALNSPAGVVAVTFAGNGLITSVASVPEKATGYGRQELIGSPITHLLADQSAFQARHMLEQARESGSWVGMLELRCRNGASLEAEATLVPLVEQDDSPGGYLLVSVCALPAAGDRRTPTMEEVGAKLRTISHELNNPLAVVMGFAQLILLNAQCEGQLRTDMEKLYSELKRVIEIVDNLHGYAILLQEKPASNS